MAENADLLKQGGQEATAPPHITPEGIARALPLVYPTRTLRGTTGDGRRAGVVDQSASATGAPGDRLSQLVHTHILDC